VAVEHLTIVEEVVDVDVVEVDDVDAVVVDPSWSSRGSVASSRSPDGAEACWEVAPVPDVDVVVAPAPRSSPAGEVPAAPLIRLICDGDGGLVVKEIPPTAANAKPKEPAASPVASTIADARLASMPPTVSVLGPSPGQPWVKAGQRGGLRP
jgi:hypothetical protein